MSFLRKLFGSGSEPPKPSDARDAAKPTDRPRPSPPLSSGRPRTDDGGRAAPPPEVPSLADLSPRALHSYFEYVGGASSKFYAVSLEEEDGDTWRVRFNYGRIGFPRAWDTRVEAVPWAKAARAYTALVNEKQGKGYELRRWPAYLTLPDGASVDDDPAGGDPDEGASRFRSARRGVLPPESGGTVAGVALPAGILYAPEPEGGSRGEDPVVWASAAPVAKVAQVWSQLAASFPETGLWPFVIDDEYGFRGFDDYLMDVPRGRHTEVLTILRRAWNDQFAYDDEFPDENLAPFGRTFPGLAPATSGDRVTSIDQIVATLTGHLGIVGVNRPADILDAVGWMGAVNIDGDPLDMTTVLRSWERRFDAYVVGLGPDTLVLAVGRPARDLATATAIAAEHYAFCPDNVDQGVGSISEYAESLVDAEQWPFWWD